MIVLARIQPFATRASAFVRSGTGRFLVHGLVLLTALLFAALNLFSPNNYNNIFLQDTLYLLNAGYLISWGLVPHIDFGWQFGGFESYLTALAFHLFGVSFKALEQSAGFAYLVAILLLYAGLFRRVRLLTFVLIFCLLSATLLTRFPFENGAPNLETQTFSMLYNRICWGLAMIMFATLLLSEERRLLPRQLLVCGTCLYLILVTKLTFLVLFPLALALIWWRGGWRGLAVAAATMLAWAAMAWLFLGYEPAAYPNALRDILDTTQDHQGRRFGPVFKLAYIIFFNIYVIAALVVAMAYVAAAQRREAAQLWQIAALLVLLGLSLGAAVATGTFYALTTTTPMLPFAAIILADRALAARQLEPQSRKVLAAALIAYAVAFSGTYMSNYLAGLGKQVMRGDEAIFNEGPLARLIVDQPDLNMSPQFRDEAHAMDYVQRRAELEGRISWMQDYEWQYMLKDGLDLLQRLPEYQSKKIIAFYPSIFPFALRSAPVTSFPLGPGAKVPSIQALQGVPADIDVVMTVRLDRANALTQRFAPSLRKDFRIVGRSRFWEVHLRNGGRALRGGMSTLPPRGAAGPSGA
jgi:hypothetical protein